MAEADKSWKAACTDQINIQELMVVYTILEAFQFRLQPFHV